MEFIAVLRQRQFATVPGGEAYVEVGPAGRLAPAQWQVVSESLRDWARENEAYPSALGVRLTYRWSGPVTDASVPECDFAVPV